MLGLRPDQVKLNQLFAGGSFGRRANPNSDYVLEAAFIAKALATASTRQAGEGGRAKTICAAATTARCICTKSAPALMKRDS